MFFRLGILNQFLTAHNSSIVKKLALLLFAVVIGKKFNLGILIFHNIVKEANCTSFSTSLGVPYSIVAIPVATWGTTHEGRNIHNSKKVEDYFKTIYPG